MTEHETERRRAWAEQMQIVHDRLREALNLVEQGVDDADIPEGVDVLLHCWGFCAALSGHHRAEDATLFPALLADRPDLHATVRRLMQDHSMIEHLLTALRHAVENGANPAVLRGHLDGVGAIMESHFRYEERELLAPLTRLGLEADPQQALGPLA